MSEIQRITPFLWFDGQAEQAAELYTSIFPNSRVLSVTRYGPGGEEVHGHAQGSVMTVEFELLGQKFVALNGGPEFSFTPAVSFQVSCDSQDEIDRYWKLLGAGGDPAAQQCGWLADRFGLSWQIVPRQLPELFGDPDPERVRRVTEAMLPMKKLDLAALERAHRG